MTYEEAAEMQVTKTEAEKEVRRHGWTWETLAAETGEEPKADADGMFSGRAILEWFGY